MVETKLDNPDYSEYFSRLSSALDRTRTQLNTPIPTSRTFLVGNRLIAAERAKRAKDESAIGELVREVAFFRTMVPAEEFIKEEYKELLTEVERVHARYYGS